MEVGFETVGNAILICHDREPILVTDPWLIGGAYFGSWNYSHQIPEEQMQSIKKAKYLWISHGHPDHLSSKSLQLLQGKPILLPNHVGGRIYNALKEQGYDVRILQDRVWYPLSDRIRVLSISDYIQDGILLVDINGRLVVDFNDATDKGWGHFVKKTIEKYDISFMLRLAGYGDADMINITYDDGTILRPIIKKDAVGTYISRASKVYGVKYYVPFSSMHVYQRSDSVWANQYRTELPDYENGFHSDSTTLLPAFVRYDCLKDTYEKINPPPVVEKVHDPKEFGDDWDEPLEESDVQMINQYFKSFEHLRNHFDFINFRVAKKDHMVELAKNRFHRGITFEAPRHSLMTAVEYQIFDDMLIGNFMKTTLHGKFTHSGLHPDFTPYVGKFGDNGLARTEEELEKYFKEYRKRSPVEYILHRIEERSLETVRSLVPRGSDTFETLKRVYYWFKTSLA